MLAGNRNAKMILIRRIVCVRCVDWNFNHSFNRIKLTNVASFAYDAWIEIPSISMISGWSESHRLRTMRGLKFGVVMTETNLKQVASFAYDAWIEMYKEGWYMANKEIVASFAYDAWIEIAMPDPVSWNHQVASFAYDAWIEIDLAVQQGYALIVASFAYDAWIEILKESSWVLFSVCRIVCVRCVDWNRNRSGIFEAESVSHRLRTMRGCS